VEQCNGYDDDGDGMVDNAPGSPYPGTLARSCTNACGVTGSQTCTNGSWGACSGCSVQLSELESYTYGIGRERLVTANAVTSTRTYFARGGAVVLAEYQETGASTAPTYSKQYVYFRGRLISAIKRSGTSESNEWYHNDRLGVRLIGAATGTTPKEQVTLPYGTLLASESTGSINYAFTMYERSTTTKLDYAINRSYMSGTGRFSTSDPQGAGAITPGRSQSFNLYAYGGNDPINGVDLLGLETCDSPDCLVKAWEAMNNAGGAGWGYVSQNATLAAAYGTDYVPAVRDITGTAEASWLEAQAYVTRDIAWSRDAYASGPPAGCMGGAGGCNIGPSYGQYDKTWIRGNEWMLPDPGFSVTAGVNTPYAAAANFQGSWSVLDSWSYSKTDMHKPGFNLSIPGEASVGATVDLTWGYQSGAVYSLSASIGKWTFGATWSDTSLTLQFGISASTGKGGLTFNTWYPWTPPSFFPQASHESYRRLVYGPP
jgi:RHS repeat-associated protein